MKIEIWPLIHNWHLFCLQKCSLSLKNGEKKNYLTPLEKSKNFKNSKIFNNIGSHDGLKTKLPRSAKMPLIKLFFASPCIYKLSALNVTVNRYIFSDRFIAGTDSAS